MGSTHFCPVDGCIASIPIEMAMCRRHWRMVPRDLQGPVYGTWRQRCERPTEETIEAHRRAVDAATAAVDLKLLDV